MELYKLHDIHFPWDPKYIESNANQSNISLINKTFSEYESTIEILNNF